MRSVLHDLAAHYTERSQDPRAAREIGKIAHRLISQHTAHVGESLPSWDLRGSSSSAVDAATDNSNSALHRYFANTIMQMQKQSTTAAHQSIPPWLRSALQGKPSQSCTDTDVDSTRPPCIPFCAPLDFSNSGVWCGWARFRVAARVLSQLGSSYRGGPSVAQQATASE